MNQHIAFDRAQKVFVAGGTGMVGSAIIRKLLSSGCTDIVTNYHNRTPLPEPSNARWVKLDLTSQADTEQFFSQERPVNVFLSAARVGGILANDTYKADFIYDNTVIAANVINCAYKFAAKKLLNLGSSCIYPRLAPQPLREEYLLTGPLEPTNEPYAIAKIAAIKLCRYFNEQYGTNFLSIMPTNLYGPHDNFNLETAHLLPALVRKFHLAELLRQNNLDAIDRDLRRFPLGFGFDCGRIPRNGETIRDTFSSLGITEEYATLWGSGEPYREFLHVDDLAEACLFLMEKYDWRDVGEFVNVGTGKDMKVKDLAEVTRQIVGFKGDIRHDPSKQDGMPRKLLDVSRIRKLGWQPTIPLEQGIQDAYKWYVGHAEGQSAGHYTRPYN